MGICNVDCYSVLLHSATLHHLTDGGIICGAALGADPTHVSQFADAKVSNFVCCSRIARLNNLEEIFSGLAEYDLAQDKIDHMLMSQ